jgi:hypothetical protein
MIMLSRLRRKKPSYMLASYTLWREIAHMPLQIEGYRLFRFRFPEIEGLAYHFDVPMPIDATEADGKAKLARVLVQMQAGLEASISHREAAHARPDTDPRDYLPREGLYLAPACAPRAE